VKLARKAAFSLKTKIRVLRLPIDIQIELFEKLVVPVLLYGSEVWGAEDISQVEVFYRKFLKQTLYLKGFTPNCMVYGESGTFELEYLVYLRMCGYWCRVLTGSKNKLSYIMYKVTRSLHYDDRSSFRSNWIGKLESIFYESGMANLWDNEMDGFTSQYIKTALKLRLIDIKKQKLSSDIQENSLCKNYRLFKEGVSFEEYLVKLEFNNRVDLCKFRCGNHQLPISKVRFMNDTDKVTNRHLTLCSKCESNQVGDELHYLLDCQYFSDERLKFLNRKRFVNPNIFTVKQIMNTKNVSKIKKIAEFVRIIMGVFEIEVVENFSGQITNYNYMYKPVITRSGRRSVRPNRLNLKF